MKKIILVFLFALLAFLAFLFFVLWGSYPNISGTKPLIGLIQPVLVERDQYGVATIHGDSRYDIARATGFLHAQERFFQMDLMRRMAAGELSELFGDTAIKIDKERRLHCFRRHAQIILPTLSAAEKTLLKAYTEGVNAGLKHLLCKPFEYFILRETPAHWKEEDSLLVGLGLFFDLQDPLGKTDWVRGIMQASLPPPVYDFFIKNGSIWDAPLDQSHLPLLSIPTAEHFKYLDTGNGPDHRKAQHLSPPLAQGSNQWAVHSSSTNTGKAILACDMHLNLFVPNIWYRLGIKYKTDTKEQIQMHGISLPGTPLIAVGSNQHIAWGFTNAYVDTTDLILLDIDPCNSGCYLTPDGPLPFDERTEVIKIKGKSPEMYKILWTKWGPVYPKLFLDKRVAIRWIAHDIDCFNFRLLDLEKMTSSFNALEILPNIQLPVLNFMVADKDGHIGWKLVGGIPKRKGYLPGLPISFTNGNNKWIGKWSKEDYPIFFDPSSGLLWTANNRTIGYPSLGKDHLNSIRAYQIRKRLLSSDKHTLSSMSALQLDDEAFFFDRWGDLLCNSLNPSFPRHKQLLAIINQWDHHCSASSLGYFWIRTFREMTMKRLLFRLLHSCLVLDPELNLSLIDFEEPIYLIASQKPPYLVDSKLGSFENEFYEIIKELLDNHCNLLIESKGWGNFNVASICHPFSQALSPISFLIDMPKDHQAGDYYVPRVAGPSVGASMRMVVSPGNEDLGIFNIPCGQSGHPLSKHYRDQHGAWVKGMPTPFLPGPPMYQLLLVP